MPRNPRMARTMTIAPTSQMMLFMSSLLLSQFLMTRCLCSFRLRPTGASGFRSRCGPTVPRGLDRSLNRASADCPNCPLSGCHLLCDCDPFSARAFQAGLEGAREADRQLGKVATRAGAVSKPRWKTAVSATWRELRYDVDPGPFSRSPDHCETGSAWTCSAAQS